MNKVTRFLLYMYFFSINFEMFNIRGLGSPARLAGIIYIMSLLLNKRLYIFSFSGIKKIVYPILLYFIFLTLISIFYINRVSIEFINLSLLFN